MGGELSDRLRSVTENITNSSMPGYRKSVITQPQFDSILQSVIEPTETATDYSQGQLRTTSNPLDFAIKGDAWFEVTKDNQTFYTRNGQFQIQPDGTLSTFTGFTVSGKSGPINIPADIPPDLITASDDGTIQARGRTLGQIKLVAFDNPDSLQRAGTTLFTASGTNEARPAENATVTNRVLESSNASLYEEMTELIQLTRAFEMNQRLIRSRDGAESQMIKTMV